MFENPEIRQMNQPKMFRKNPRRTNYSSIFLQKFRIWPFLNYLHDSNSIFRAAGINSKGEFSGARYPATSHSSLRLKILFESFALPQEGRLGRRTNSCSAGFTTVSAGARSKCSKSELHRHMETCGMALT